MKKLVLIVLLIPLVGCLTAGMWGKKKSPAETASLYYKFLMWKYYDRASQFVDHEKRYDYDDFVSRNEEKLNITAYELKEVIYNDDQSECTINVLIRYYRYPSVSEKSVITEDTWILKEKNWFILSDFKDGIYNQ